MSTAGIVGVTVSLESLLAASELMSINTGSYTWALTMPTSLASHATPWPTSNSSMQPMPPHMILTSVDVAKKGSGYDFSNAWALYNEGVRSSHSGLEDPVTRDIPMQQQSVSAVREAATHQDTSLACMLHTLQVCLLLQIVGLERVLCHAKPVALLWTMD